MGQSANFEPIPSSLVIFPSFLTTYKSNTYKSQVGIAWVILDYFPSGRSYFVTHKEKKMLLSSNP